MKCNGIIFAALLIVGCGTEATMATNDETEPVGVDEASGSQIEPPQFSIGGGETLEAQNSDETWGGDLASTQDQHDPFDEDEAREKAEDDLQGETYRSVGRPYGCTEDCSGHDAGFQYRANNRYGGRIAGDYDARSFRQGQQAYDDEVDRRVEEAQEAYDAGTDY